MRMIQSRESVTARLEMAGGAQTYRDHRQPSFPRRYAERIHDALGQFRRSVDEMLAIVEHDKNFHINNRVQPFIMSVGVRRKAKAVRHLLELIS